MNAPDEDVGRDPALPAPRAPVRLAILDDHELLLDGLSSWVTANAPDFEVVLTASTWLQLVHSPNFPAELVIQGFQLEDPVSIEARVRTCRASGAKVIILSSSDSRAARDRALAAGAADVVSTTLPMAELMVRARRAMGIDHGQAPQREWRPLPTGAAIAQRPRLSPGEQEALRLYVAGDSTSEVAARMNVKYETAKTYLRRVREKYAKAGRPAGRRADLMRRAAEDGYLE